MYNNLKGGINIIKEYIKLYKDLFIKHWFDEIGIGKFIDAINKQKNQNKNIYTT